jgi:NAD(P)-dependent dehydrogenase (short-subunit alcohol dehydrogenase family)
MATTQINRISNTLNGVVVLITGATSGIGLGLTRWLYRHDATVIAMGRSASKLEALYNELRQQEFDNNTKDGERSVLVQQPQRFFPVVADFADLQSVSSAVDAMVRGEYYDDFVSSDPDEDAPSDATHFPDHIDILVNNAGMHLGLETMWDPTYQPATKDGYDLVFQTNYLAHFLLTEKLLPTLLARSSSPRVVQVTSTFHFAVDGSDLNLTNPGSETRISSSSSAKSNAMTTTQTDPVASRPGGSHGFWIYRSQRQYANSKLAQILHSRFLQRQQELEEEGHRYATASFMNACPAWVGTSIVRHALIMGSSDAIETSWQARIFRYLAFSSDGFGLSSILRAMFDDNENCSVDSSSSVKLNGSVLVDDYYSNTELMRKAGPFDEFLTRYLPSRWSYNLLPIRDMTVGSSSLLVLPLQRFFPSMGRMKSSGASYDETLQQNLYTWSRQAVSEWLWMVVQ